jgi:glycosyltransferase involved in cell wall biosynthesis
VKILHLSYLFAQVGGAEHYLHNLLPLLEAAGHENVVIYRQAHPLTPPPAGKTILYFAGTDNAQNGWPEIKGIIGQERPDLIYFHAPRDPNLVETISQLGPTVIYIQDFFPLCPGLAKFFRRGVAVCNRPYGLGCVPMIYLRRCASARHPVSVYRIMQATRQQLAAHQNVSHIMVASHYMRDLLAQNGLDHGRVSILPLFTQLPDRVWPIETPADGPRLLFAGRLETEKGLPYLLRALARVDRPYRLLVAGDGHERAAYEALAQQLGIADRVDFLGWLNQSELTQRHRQATCLVVPSIWPEPFGMVGIDAFSHGRPVIAFNVGGISDWLQDGHNGYLVPAQDVTQLAGRIEALLAQPALAAQMGANGRRTAEERYTGNQHLTKLLAIFTAVVQENGMPQNADEHS